MNNTTNSNIGCAYVPRKHKQWWKALSHMNAMMILRVTEAAGVKFITNRKNAG